MTRPVAPSDGLAVLHLAAKLRLDPLAAAMGRGRLVSGMDVHSALASDHLFPDYVHPGAEGALRIATEVERVLTATVPGTWSFSNRTRERV